MGVEGSGKTVECLSEAKVVCRNANVNGKGTPKMCSVGDQVSV